MSKHVLISIVILSWDKLNETKKCLESIRELRYSNKEIIVVDNGSVDGSKGWLEKQKDIIYVDLLNNTGFAGGQNEAYKHAKGEYIALVNNDAVVAKDWLEESMKTFKMYPKAAVVGGKAYIWDDAHRAHSDRNPFYSYQVVDINYGYAETLQCGEQEVSVNSISGAGVVIKRKAIERVGYFDDRFFAYYEESDLFARMKRAGYIVMYNPNMHTWHKIGQSTKDKPYFYLYQMHRNRFLYGYKNFDEPQLKNLVARYNLEGKAALKRVALGSKELDDKARVNAYKWNKLNMRKTKKLRTETLKIGDKYSELLLDDATQNVSIVIPCYNYEKFVGSAIESAINQSQKPAEIIVINDGSTDNSKKIIEKYKEHINFIDKKNEGVIKAKNLGLEEVKSSWLIFLDADDLLDKDYIKKCMYRARLKSADIVYTNMKLFGSRNEKFIAREHDIAEIRKGNYIHNSALLKTELVKAVGGYKEEMRGGYEDWELYLSMFEMGAKSEWINEDLLHYRQHDTNSRNLLAKQKGIEYMQKAVDLHPNIFGRKFDVGKGKTFREIRIEKAKKRLKYVKILWPPTWYRQSKIHTKRIVYIRNNKQHLAKIKKHLKSSSTSLKKVKIRTALLESKNARKHYRDIDKKLRKK